MGCRAVLQLTAVKRARRNTMTWQKNVMDEKEHFLLLCINQFCYSTSVLKRHHMYFNRKHPLTKIQTISSINMLSQQKTLATK